MKDKLIDLTVKLTNAGFKISGLEVEASDLVRIRFQDLKGLELLVNSSFAKIDEGECTKDQIINLEKIVEKFYVIKNELISSDDDMFNKLLKGS